MTQTTTQHIHLYRGLTSECHSNDSRCEWEDSLHSVVKAAILVHVIYSLSFHCYCHLGLAYFIKFVDLLQNSLVI